MKTSNDQQSPVRVQPVVRARRDTILMRCLKKGCPRTRRVPRPDDVGKNVAEIHSDCPWHEKEGMKAYPEYFYDAKGRELDWETWKPRK